MIKKFSYILLMICVLQSCRNDDKLCLEYLTRFKETINLIENQNNIIYLDFKDFMIDYPLKLEPWFNKMMLVRNKKDSLFSLLDSIVSERTNITSGEIRSYIEKKNIPDFKTALKNTDIELITNKIEDYKKTILSIFDDKKKYAERIEFINKGLTTKDFNQTMTFRSKTVKIPELLANIYKLKSEILIAENEIFSFLNSQISTSDFKFNKREVFVVPNSQNITVGQQYKAEMFLCVFDTTANPTYEIDGITYRTESGVGLYKYQITEIPGICSKNGIFSIKSPYTGEIQKIPFKIEYEVLEKK